MPSMLPWSAPLKGSVDQLTLVSEALKGNPLGDPYERPVWVQLPPDYDEDTSRRYPVIYVLMGYGGLVPNLQHRQPYAPTLPESVEALHAGHPAAQFLTVYLDGWTRYGGSQYVDSPGTGKYHTFFCDEVVPFVDGLYRTLPERNHRAVTGKSSGGFGAMVTAMLRPDLFSVLATHAGDALYETNYMREFGAAARALREYDGDIMAFWADFISRPPFAKASDQILWVLLGVAACFSAEADASVVLPFDTVNGRVREDVWARWLAWDPVRMLEKRAFAQAMLSMNGIWVDAGINDEFNLDLGAQAFADGLTAIGVPPDRLSFELVDANHWTISHRYPAALRWVADKIAPA